jgi:hypothetical protein
MSDQQSDIVFVLPPAATGYWAESRRPLVSLAFIAPWLLCYEVGSLWLGVQNGAEAWMRMSLDRLGLSQHFLLPVLTVAILLGWHHVARQPWRVSGRVLGAMAVECGIMAVALWIVYRVQWAVVHAVPGPVVLSISDFARDGVRFLGAGIYEELLFRLILLSAVIWGFRKAGCGPRASLVWAVALTSLLFAAAHHVPPHGEQFETFRFAFRVVAGVFFSALFIYRGFGIAAGAHAAYDILVGLLLPAV